MNPRSRDVRYYLGAAPLVAAVAAIAAASILATPDHNRLKRTAVVVLSAARCVAWVLLHGKIPVVSVATIGFCSDRVTLLQQLAALLVIAWVPGAVLFRAPFAGRAHRAKLAAEERLFWSVIISVTVSLSVTLLLAGAGAYTFNRLLIANASLAALVAVGARFRLRYSPDAARPALTMLLPAGLLVLALWQFFPPAEYVMGGKDPGTYLSEGIQIAQRGSLVTRDTVIASVPATLRDLFFPSHNRPYYFGVRFMGFFIQNPDRGTVVGQFPHLFPASIAIGYGVDGLTGARRTVGCWAALGLVAVYFAGVRLAGRTAATAAATLLGVHVLQVWYARYPNAEIMMQPLLLAAVMAVDRALANNDRFFAVLAAVLLGLLMWLRFDVVLALAAVGAAVALSFPKRRTLPWAMLVPLVGLCAIAYVYLTTIMTGYSAYPLGFSRDWLMAPVVAAIAAGAALFWISRSAIRVERFERYFPAILITVAIAAAGYAWFLRDMAGKTAIHDAASFRTFGTYYLSPAGLIAALAGFAYVTMRRFWLTPALLSTICVFAFFFFYKIRIVPEHFWMGRRFLPVILPGALLFVTAFAFSTLDSSSRRRSLAGAAVGFVFVVLLGQYYARVAAPVRHHIEYAGMIPRVEALSQKIRDNDLLVVESRDASDIHVLALPLAYIYARNVLVLSNPVPDKAAFRAFLDWAHTRYERVMFLGSGGTDLLSPLWSVQPVASDRFRVPEFETTPWHTFPRLVREKEFDYGIYVIGAAAPANEGGFDLDVGFRDDLHTVRFHAKEETEGRTIRWTGRTSYVAVAQVTTKSRVITLWMSDGGRPPSATAATVSVYLQDRLLGTSAVSTGFRPYQFSIPPDLATKMAADAARLRLVSTVWTPRKTLGTGDDRELGVMVDRVQIR